MSRIYFVAHEKFPDTLLAMMYMFYVTLVVASIVLFSQMVQIDFLGMTLDLSGSLFPYVLLYPVSFIVLKIYGYKTVNQMIGCMILISLVFVVFCHIITALPVQPHSLTPIGLRPIMASAYKMYLGGFIALPAGLYSSFLMLSILDKIHLHFSAISLAIATAIGEIVNTIIVFPIGFHGAYSLKTIFSKIIIDALVFKIIAGAILAVLTMLIINLLIIKYRKGSSDHSEIS